MSAMGSEMDAFSRSRIVLDLGRAFSKTRAVTDLVPLDGKQNKTVLGFLKQRLVGIAFDTLDISNKT